MSITKYAFKNPTIIIAIFLAITVLGTMFSIMIRKERLPEFPLPAYQIVINDSGMSATEIYQLITKPTESALQSVPYLLWSYGTTMPGKSMVTLVCEIGSDTNKIYKSIQKTLGEIQHKYPGTAKKPIIKEVAITDEPVIWLSLKSRHKSLFELSRFAEKKLKPLLEELPHVKAIHILGTVPKKIRVQLDQVAMSKYGIELGMVFDAFKRKNVVLPGGQIDTGIRRYNLKLDFNLKSLNEIRHMIVTYRAGKAIYLNSIAAISVQSTPDKGSSYIDGYPTVFVTVEKTNEGNSLSVINEVNQVLDSTDISNESGIEINKALSQGNIIKSYLWSLLAAILYSLLFCVLTVYFFIGSWKLSLITLLVIPVSLATAVISLMVNGLSFNVLTLLGFVLLIGLAIDDAIIIIENYISKLTDKASEQQGSKAILAAEELSSSIISYAMCLIFVFMGMLHSASVTKVLFKSISAVIIPGVIISAIVSLSITPLTCAYWIVKPPALSNFSEVLTLYIEKIREKYIKSVQFVLKHSKTTLLLFFMLPLPLVYLIPNMDQSLFPTNSEQSEIIITAKKLGLVTSKQFNKKVLEAGEIIRTIPHVKNTYTVTNAHNHALIYVKIKAKHGFNTGQTVNAIQKKLDNLVGLNSLAFTPGILIKKQQPFRFVIYGETYKKMLQFAEKLPELFDKVPKIGRVLIKNIPLQATYKLEINRHAAAEVGLTPQEIARAVSLYGGDIKVGHTKYVNNDEYDIYLYSGNKSLVTPLDLQNIYIYNKQGQSINLDALASIKIEATPNIIESYDNKPSLLFESTPTTSLNHAEKLVKDILAPALPPKVKIAFLGQVRIMERSFNSFAIALSIAIMLIYFVLASQFKSFFLPLMALIGQPIAISLVIYVLYFTGIGFNMFSLMGIFILLGLKTKNFILIISLMKQIHAEGKGAYDAVTIASRQRFRPIVMTTLVILLGMLPTILTSGPTHSYNLSLAVPIVAGVLSSTLFSLYFLPVAFIELINIPKWIMKHWRKTHE